MKEQEPDRDAAACWFCERKVGIGYLIAGYDTFDEQRLACLDCDRTIKAFHDKGWSLRAPGAASPEPVDDLRALEAEWWRYEATAAQLGSGQTKDQQTGAHMVWAWLRSRLSGDPSEERT